jgi:hypothetical protein
MKWIKQLYAEQMSTDSSNSQQNLRYLNDRASKDVLVKWNAIYVLLLNFNGSILCFFFEPNLYYLKADSTKMVQIILVQYLTSI